MAKTDGEWLLTYFQRALGLKRSEGYDLYSYLKDWRGDYEGIVERFQRYPPAKSLPAIMYAFAVVHPTGILEMGRATHRLTIHYGIEKSAPIVFQLFDVTPIDNEFLECLSGEPKPPNMGLLERLLESFFDREKEYNRFIVREARKRNKSVDEFLEDLRTRYYYAQHNKCLLLYFRMCALAAVHDMWLAVGSIKYRDLRDEILDVLEISLQRHPWRDSCRKPAYSLHNDEIIEMISLGLYDEIVEISLALNRKKYSYYWDKDYINILSE